MEKLELVLQELYDKADELTILLEPFSKDIAKVSSKPLAEMSISEKARLAHLVVSMSNEYKGGAK